jgi:cytochrome c oxidase cbb3-type subunit III
VADPHPFNRPDQSDPSIDYHDLRDHVFDGIQEYDKKMPNWWLLTFYGAIAFSIGYWMYFHIADLGLSDDQRLALERSKAMAAGFVAISEEDLLAMSHDPAVLSAGRTTFTGTCAACHGPKGEGTAAAPSLVDGTWLHGSDPMQIRHTILEGVTGTGMPAWRQLGERRINELTAFIINLNGSQ